MRSAPISDSMWVNLRINLRFAMASAYRLTDRPMNFLTASSGCGASPKRTMLLASTVGTDATQSRLVSVSRSPIALGGARS